MMSEQELIEQLADKEHAGWAHWMDYLFSRCPFTEKGDAIIPRELVARWKQQVKTPYADLTEQEKKSDRDEVAHILPIIDERISQEIDTRNKAYAERNMCIALIARLAEMLGYNVGMKRHEGEDWEDDWRHVIFIDLPTGQLSWHLHDSEMENFPGIVPYLKEWDGHTTEEKYQRIAAFIHLGE